VLLQGVREAPRGARRRAAHPSPGACALGHAAGAQAAGPSSIAYTSGDLSLPAAYLVDWKEKKHRAHVVEFVGAADGSYTDDGRQRASPSSRRSRT